MSMEKIVAFVVVTVVGIVSANSDSHGFCGQSKPDHSKTCISVRLPWKAEPVYFCTEKESIKYEKTCKENERCTPTEWTNKTLLIATPWDCCPLQSFPIPSHCGHISCPPKPLNRTCVTLTTKSSGGCCPSYNCEENGHEEQSCNFKMLEPSCHMPPADKKNCVGFVDPYGCCTKYQCEGEAKTGMCPNWNYYSTTTFGYNAEENHKHIQPPKKREPQTMKYEMPAMDDKKSQRRITNKMFKMNQNPIPCIGDFNCPGEMKCCASSFGIHGHNIYASHFAVQPTVEGMDGEHTVPFYDKNAIYGQCVHPIKPKKPVKKTDDEIEETDPSS